MDETLTPPPAMELVGPVDPAAVAEEAAPSIDEAELVAEIYEKYERRRQLRKPFEIQWYLNASALRGFPDVRWNVELERLEVKREPAHRKRFRINLIKPKYVAKVAKYTKIPPNPTVVPATTDREDIFNARASQKALEYFTRKGNLRAKWVQVMQWVPITGKSFWSIRFDEDAISHAPTRMEDSTLAPITGEVEVEFCSAFEMLPDDPGIELMANQPEMTRVRLVATAELEKRWKLEKGSLSSDSTEGDLFHYQRQIADLGAKSSGQGARTSANEKNKQTLLIENFTASNSEFPHGRYVVVAGRKLLHHQDSMPGNFSFLSRNPYPFIEFCDDAAPGQYWPDAFIERLIGLQSEYNEYRSKMGENLAMHFFPKLVVPKQLQMDDQAYTSEAGERLNVNWIPGIPMPMFLQPSSVIGDAWNIIQMIKKEFDDVTLIYPSSLGGAGGASSGFQTTLLQEAADQVHGPTIQRNAIALEEAYIKIRHLQKQFYDIPRLISITGKSSIPEVYEFSRDTIDEHADIRIEPDTMMPQLRAARIDQIRQMFTDGLFGVPSDVKTQRRAQDMLRMSFSDFEIERDQRDQEQAQMENIAMVHGEPLKKPQPWENHDVHWDSHVDLWKSPESTDWTPEQWKVNVFHGLVHLCYLNPNDARTMAREFDLEQEIEALIAAIAPVAPPPAPEVEQEAPPSTIINNHIKMPMNYSIKRNQETGLMEGIESQLAQAPRPSGFKINRNPVSGLLESIEPQLGVAE